MLAGKVIQTPEVAVVAELLMQAAALVEPVQAVMAAAALSWLDIIQMPLL